MKTIWIFKAREFDRIISECAELLGCRKPNFYFLNVYQSADLLNRELFQLQAAIQELFGEANSTSSLIYEFPSVFYYNWSKVGFSQSGTLESAFGAGYNNSSYQRMFLETLNKSISSGNYSTSFAAVEASVHSSASSAYGNLFLTNQILNYTNLFNYSTTLPNFVAALIDKNTGFDSSRPVVVSDYGFNSTGIQ